MSKDVTNGIKNTLVMFACFAIIAWLGSKDKTSWYLVVVAPALIGGVTYLFKKNMAWTFRSAAFALVAAILWNVFA